MMKKVNLLQQMKRVTVLQGTILLFCLLPAFSLAAPSKEKILQKVDKAEESSSASKVTMKMTLSNKAGKQRERKAVIFQKGKDRRLIQFISPADMRMVGLLVKGDEMYVYLPSYRRVRRVASHIKNSSFMGSDFTYEDMGSLSFGKDYTVKKMAKKKGSLILTLERRPGSQREFKTLKLWVRPKDYLYTRVDYRKKGKVVKRLLREDFREVDKNQVPHRLTMKTLSSQHKTVIELQKINIKARIRRRLFSQRYLKRQLY